MNVTVPQTQQEKRPNHSDWAEAVAHLKDGTKVDSFMSAFSNILKQVPTDGIDPTDEAVLKLWRILVAANWEMSERKEYVRLKRTDGNYGHAIFKIASLLASLDLNQDDKRALSTAVGKPLPNWSDFKYTGSANPAEWPSGRKSRVAGISGDQVIRKPSCALQLISAQRSVLLELAAN